jgi:hypothetical protein
MKNLKNDFLQIDDLRNDKNLKFTDEKQVY